MKERKIPMRMCNGCSEMKPKIELVRIVRANDNTISLDMTGKLNGRGAYICKSAECLKKARKSKRIDRTFNVTIPDEIYDSIEREFANNG